jgi:hypothetical protein
MNRQKTSYFILLSSCFIGAFVSMFFPYLEKLGWQNGQLSIFESVPGYAFFLMPFILITMILAAFTHLHWSFFWSVFHIGLVYLNRFAIHYQGFIDHDYDSKAGLGYYLLCLFSSIFFILTTVNWFKSYGDSMPPTNIEKP